MTISMDKKYRTRDGDGVTILTTTRRNSCSVVGLIHIDGYDELDTWSLDGAHGISNGRNLIEIKPKILYYKSITQIFAEFPEWDFTTEGRLLTETGSISATKLHLLGKPVGDNTGISTTFMEERG